HVAGAQQRQRRSERDPPQHGAHAAYLSPSLIQCASGIGPSAHACLALAAARKASLELVVQTTSPFFISMPGSGARVAEAASAPFLSFGGGGPQSTGQKVKATMRPSSSNLVGC